MTIPLPHDADLRRLHRRAAAVPVAATLAGSATALLPVIAEAPVLPPFGLLMLIGWRLLRPELWPVWIGLPLGLADDLVSGRPLGTAMVLWTLALIVIEATEDRMAWRGRREEWLLAALACGIATLGGWAAAGATGGGAPLRAAVPAMAAGILCFPLAQRLCAVLDRWRLKT